MKRAGAKTCSLFIFWVSLGRRKASIEKESDKISYVNSRFRNPSFPHVFPHCYLHLGCPSEDLLVTFRREVAVYNISVAYR